MNGTNRNRWWMLCTTGLLFLVLSGPGTADADEGVHWECPPRCPCDPLLESVEVARNPWGIQQVWSAVLNALARIVPDADTVR